MGIQLSKEQGYILLAVLASIFILPPYIITSSIAWIITKSAWKGLLWGIPLTILAFGILYFIIFIIRKMRNIQLETIVENEKPIYTIRDDGTKIIQK